MIAKDPQNKKVYLPSTVSPDTAEALNEMAKETGNRSHIVDKALRLYLGLNENEKQEPELKAS
jgi:metal-responsive CopG/Arc/MetJ family transcriptional regulator